MKLNKRIISFMLVCITAISGIGSIQTKVLATGNDEIAGQLIDNSFSEVDMCESDSEILKTESDSDVINSDEDNKIEESSYQQIDKNQILENDFEANSQDSAFEAVFHSLSDLSSGENVNDKIVFFNIKLEMRGWDSTTQSFVWLEIPENISNWVFLNTGSSQGEYRFSAEWEADALNTTFCEGDYFDFKLPIEFQNQTIPMTSGGIEWGLITVDENGNGTAVFNENIVTLQEVHGNIAFFGKYSVTSAGVPVDWKFEFNGSYEYGGTSKGPTVGTSPVSNILKGVTDPTYSGKRYERWNLMFNQGQKTEGFTGTPTVTDTFAGGYHLVPAGNLSSITPHFTTENGYYGANGAPTNDAYFWILDVDVNEMRRVYNDEHPDNAVDDDKYHSYFSSTMIFEKYKSTDSLPAGKAVGDYKYMTPYTGGVDATITNDGFVLEFPSGALEQKCLWIFYWTELTSSVMPPERLVNNVKLEVADKTYSEGASISAGGSATVTGTNGSLTIYKRDSKEQEADGFFENVSFTLTKVGGGNYNKTLKADEDGKIIFKLDAPYAGTYTLSEDPATVPNGYGCADPITLVLDSSGKITSVNGTSVAGGGLSNIDYRVSPDGLVMLVFNKKAQTGSIKLTKVDADNHNKLLDGAKFHLYYMDDNTPYYYTDSGTWSTDIDDAKQFETSSGVFTAAGLKYRTYYLEEVEAPAGYALDSTPIEVVINSETTKNETMENTLKTGSITLTGTKSLSGKSLVGGDFSFVLTGVGNSTSLTATNDKNGNITFDPINYIKIGTYTYTISETNSAAYGISYDPAIYTVTVTVANGTGSALTATAVYEKNGQPASSIQFSNQYRIGSTSIALTGTKTFTGKSLVGGDFNFTLAGIGNGTSLTASNDVNGNIVFNPINYTSAGTYTYTISEINTGINRVIYDTSIFTVTVTVVNNVDGTLTATAVYEKNGQPASSIQFSNQYTVNPTSIILTGTKMLDGAQLQDNQFDFAVYENDTVVATGKNTAAGVITFSKIEYTKPGNHSYTVRETSLSGNGYVIDHTMYIVNVKVDALDGKLVATASYPEGGVVFRNSYTPDETPEDGNVSLVLSKQLTNPDGSTGANGKPFAVRIYDDAMNLIERVILYSNSSAVTVVGLSHGKTYYIMEETTDTFTVLGYYVSGVGFTTSKAIGLHMPEGSANLSVSVTVRNQTIPGVDIPDDPPPLGPGEPPKNPPIIDIPDNPTPLDPGKPDNPDKSNPQTGDVSNLALWVSLMIGALSGMVFLLMWDEKRRKDPKQSR